jgi:formylglycine-generating enzyme required for sulfatase activity
VLLLFDGLDEVPFETKREVRAGREDTLRAVHSFTQRYDKIHAILTCRTRAFDDKYRDVLHWETTTIAPWTLGQIREFVQLWYDAKAKDGHLKQEHAKRLHNDLINTIDKSERLRDMAGTPLLTTMMALVLEQQGRLPHYRPTLYENILNLLLGQWDAARQVKSLAEAVDLLEWDAKDFRKIVNELAYQAHALGQDLDKRGQLSASKIREELARLFTQKGVTEPWVRAARFLQYIDQRSGLLLPESNDTYVFAHLTLQEYCAGCYMAEDAVMETKVLEHREDDRWRVPIKLGMGVAHKAVLNSVLHALVARQQQGVNKSITRWYRDLLLVAEIGKDRNWDMLRGSGDLVKVDSLQQQLREGLVVLLDDARQPLPFEERRQAAEYLARLGDPRIPIAPSSYATSEYVKAKKYWYPFPNKAIARQAYIIGGWDSPAKATLPIAPFWITRYPITVAQFAKFVTEGYSSNGKRWWTGAGWEWKTTTGRTAPEGWNPKYANQPVVGVTWYEATAFAAWLNEHIQQQHPHWQARLPTEAEWEAAAASAPDGSRRPYPWGTERPNDELAVFEASQLNSPPPVGLCPKGSSSCGVLDMAGTVSEWVSSVYSRYPQHSHQVQNDVRPGDLDIAIRGGSFRNKSDSLQCGKRIRMRPEQSLDSVGFRLVVVKRT